MKKKVSYGKIIVILSVFVFQNTNIFAHEMFIETSTKKIVVLSFNERTPTGNIWLKVDYSGLKKQSYKNNISGIYKWNNIVVNQQTNKKIVVSNESVWNSNIRYFDDAKNSTRKIAKAYIYMNPNVEKTFNSDNISTDILNERIKKL